MRVCGCMRFPRGCTGIPLRAGAGGIYGSACDGRMRGLSSVGSRALAAGVTWTLVIAKAPWAGRYGHTSVIDAAGAIYVIGGSSYSDYNDVWVTTDKGVDGTRSVLGGTRLVLAGYYRGGY